MRLTALQKLQVFACLVAVGSIPLQKQNKPTATKQPIHVSHTNSFLLILCHWNQFYYEQCKAGNLKIIWLMWKIGDVTLFLDLFSLPFLILG